MKGPGGLADVVAQVYDEMATHRGSGRVADYIPALARIDPQRFGLSVMTCDGEHADAGDFDVPFSIQSISKVFTLTLVLDAIGDTLWERVGREPSGSPFNSIVQLEREQGVPRNPLINAGALVTTDALMAGRQPSAAVAELLAFLRTLAMRPSASTPRWPVPRPRRAFAMPAWPISSAPSAICKVPSATC